jgi:hypothetical protein
VSVVGLTAALQRDVPAPAATPVLAPAAAAAAPAALPAAARRHLDLAEDYQRKLWCSDALDELERALLESASPQARTQAARVAIPCLRAKTQPRAIQFLVANVGPAAREALQSALATDLKPDVREGVERALARLFGMVKD